MGIKAEESEQERARQNRLLVAAGIGNKFYDEQQSIAEGWKSGTPKPKKLITADGDTTPAPKRNTGMAAPFRGDGNED